MLRLFRVRLWCLVTALFLGAGTSTATISELLHAGTPHDADCASPLDIAHDASSHRVRSTTDAAGGVGHCFACHWARSFRIGTDPVSVTVRLDDAGDHALISSIGAVLAPPLLQLPARSPPRVA